MKPNRFAAFALLAIVLLAPPSSASGDSPSADYIFPAGGQRGTTVKFLVGGNFFHGEADLELPGKGLKPSAHLKEVETQFFEGPMIFKPASQRAENYPRDHAGQVAIEDDAPLGASYWRIRTSQGVTPSRPFVVGDLPEIVEREVDGKPLPTQVATNVTINGRIFPREDVDIWTFDARAGRTYHFEVVASQIQSPLDSLIQVFDADGRLVAENDDSDYSSDSELRFRAESDGAYRVHIFDSQFRGLQNYVYRLTLREGPVVSRAFPLGGQAQRETKLRLFGAAMPTDAQTALPATLQPGRRRVHVPVPGSPYTQPLRLDIDDLTEYEFTPDHQPLTGSFIANGELRGDEKSHVWTWQTDKGKKYNLALASNSTSIAWKMAIEDETGKTLAAFEPDPARPQQAKLTFTGVEKPVRVRVERGDHASSESQVYRLTCRERKPDFQLKLSSDALTLYRGQKAGLKINVERTDFAGEIKLVVKGVPADAKVKADDAKVAKNKPNATVNFTAEADATVQPLRLTIVGEAEINGEKVSRTAVLDSPLSHQDRKELVVGVSMPTPFTLDGVAFETRYGPRGTIFRRHFIVHRNGYEGPLTLRLADRQIRHLQGVTAAAVMTLPADKSEFDFPIRIPTWLEMNRTSRTVVMAIGKVEDEQGREHTVSFSSGAPKDQIILLTAPCPIALKTDIRSVKIAPGQTLDLKFSLDRGVLKPASARVVLITPEHFDGIDAEPVQLKAEETTGVLRVRVRNNLSTLNMPITIRAEMAQGGDTVIAETKVELTR